eukprot:g41088.t1
MFWCTARPATTGRAETKPFASHFLVHNKPRMPLSYSTPICKAGFSTSGLQTATSAKDAVNHGSAQKPSQDTHATACSCRLRDFL